MRMNDESTTFEHPGVGLITSRQLERQHSALQVEML